MELTTKPFYIPLKRYWRRRSYQRLDGASTRRKNVKITRLRGGSSSSSRRFWRIKAVPKLRFPKIGSPFQVVWRKIKNAYVGMMVNLAGKVGYLNDENYFLGKGVSKAGQVGVVYSSEEVENRVAYEIYKALVASGQLSAVLHQIQ